MVLEIVDKQMETVNLNFNIIHKINLEISFIVSFL